MEKEFEQGCGSPGYKVNIQLLEQYTVLAGPVDKTLAGNMKVRTQKRQKLVQLDDFKSNEHQYTEYIRNKQYSICGIRVIFSFDNVTDMAFFKMAEGVVGSKK